MHELVSAEQIEEIAERLSVLSMFQVPNLKVPGGMDGAEIHDLSLVVGQELGVHPSIVEKIILIKQTQI